MNDGTVKMGNILTSKIPWLLNDPRSILKKKEPLKEPLLK